MEIYVLGYFLIPLGIVLLFLKPDMLFYLTVFFAPFTASALLSVSKIITGLQPVYYFAVLWVLSVIIRNTCKLKNIKQFYKHQLSNNKRKFINLTLLFWLASLISFLTPIIFKNKVINFAGNMSLKLYVSKGSVTQFFYLTLILLFTDLSVVFINNKERLYSTIKTFMYSLLFTAIWGIFQFISFYFRIPYPYYIFNNNKGYAQLWYQIIYNIHRVNSVATEPSTYSFFLLMMIPFVLIFWIYDLDIFKKTYLTILLIFTLMVTFLTTSTTSYIGLILILLLILILNIYFNFNKQMNLNKKSNRGFVNIIILIISIILIVSFIIVLATHMLNIKLIHIIGTLKFVSINKLNTKSGIDRRKGFVNAIEVFFHSPIIGVGWGRIRSFDLISTLLANTGILGALSFVAVVFYSLKSILKTINIKDNSLSVISLSIGISIIMGLFSFAVAIPDIFYYYFWIVIGMAISLNDIKN
ncbi:MAG: hypothetical protein QME45_10250 [Clostridiales bacterium]|nr:hypothetical protein [Clostridiales bacterium]